MTWQERTLAPPTAAERPGVIPSQVVKAIGASGASDGLAERASWSDHGTLDPVAESVGTERVVRYGVLAKALTIHLGHGDRVLGAAVSCQ